MDKRKIVQALAALLQNANIKGFLEGSVYRGPLKQICVPGLNCYSCPGALGSCPIGALQALSISPQNGLSFYAYGLILLIGVIGGRFVCGFLCPFGLVQELLYKIPLKKLRERPFFKTLNKLKYLILILLVIGLPTIIMLTGGIGFPAFCQWLCPAGTLGAGIPLAITNDGIRGAIGLTFAWKALVLLLVLVGAVKLFRPFCRFLCPLGALYSLLNKISIVHIHTDESKCGGCGGCMKVCGMAARNPDDLECIRCGKCVTACPSRAKKWSCARNSKAKQKRAAHP